MTVVIKGRRYVEYLPVDVIIPKLWYHPVLYRLHRDLEVNSITIPKGFVSDGATVTRWLWWLFPPVCRYLRAALLHDYLLEQGVDFRTANKHFRTALRESGVPKWRKYLMHAAVEVYGLLRRNRPTVGAMKNELD